MAAPADPVEPDLDALRRRVYAADATEADRAAYAAAVAEDAVSDAPTAERRMAAPTTVEEHSASYRSRVAAALAGGAVALVLLGAVLATVLPRTVAGPPPPSPTPIAVDRGTRAEFVRNLVDSGPAGLAAYLVTHRSPRGLGHVARAFTIERWGTGPRTFSLRPTDAATRKGRATVLLVVDRSGPVRWTASELRPTTDSESPLLPQAARAGEQQAGVPTTATFPYAAGHRPVALHVDVPKGTRWGAAVVFTD